MARIVLEYDARSIKARKTIDFILSLDLFKVATEKTKKGLKQAIRDAENGRIYEAKNSKDLIKKCLS